MNFLFQQSYIGISFWENQMRTANLNSLHNSSTLSSLHTFEGENLAQHLRHKNFTIESDPIVAATLKGTDVIVKTIFIPLFKEKEIAEALNFQIEPYLPYPVDEAILTSEIISSSHEGSLVTVTAVKKDALMAKLDFLRQLGIEPQFICSLQSALASFTQNYLSTDGAVIALHLAEDYITAALVQGGKVTNSYTQLIDSYSSNIKPIITKLTMSLKKDLGEDQFRGICLSFTSAEMQKDIPIIFEELNCNLLEPTLDGYDNIGQYVESIGAATAASSEREEALNFRKAQFSDSNSYKQLYKPLGLYLTLITTLSILLFAILSYSIASKEKLVKQDFVHLMASQGKNIVTEQGIDLFSQDSSLAKDISIDDVWFQLGNFQQQLEAMPDVPNIPRVTDVLAWLSSHPNVVVASQDGSKPAESKLVLENFYYQLVKRPQKGKKNERYQVKLELEFSSKVPKMAREFHDELLKSKEIVDLSQEIKWSANQNVYKTSMYLKDKTSYL